MPLKHLKLFRRNFIALHAYIRKEERYLTSDLSFHLKKPEYEEKIKYKISRREETINIRRDSISNIW